MQKCLGLTPRDFDSDSLGLAVGLVGLEGFTDILSLRRVYSKSGKSLPAWSIIFPRAEIATSLFHLLLPNHWLTRVSAWEIPTPRSTPPTLLGVKYAKLISMPQVGENNILGRHHSIMEALCKVVTGERNDFIFHFDNWVKQIPGSSAKVLCPHSYPKICLATKRCCKEKKSRFFSQWHLVTEMLKHKEEKVRVVLI